MKSTTTPYFGKNQKYKAIMMVLSCLFLVNILAYSPLQAQIKSYEAKTVKYTKEALTESFKHYEVYQLETSEITTIAKKADQFQLKLKLDKNREWDLLIQYYDMRSPDYQEVVITEKGHTVLPPRRAITYKGYNNSYQPGEEVRLSITDKFIMGFVTENGKEIFIEPLRFSIEDAPENYYLVYEAADLKDNPTLRCGALEVEGHKPHHEENKNALLGDEKSVCKEVDFLSAATYDMVFKHGSIVNVNNHIQSITNMMEALYAPLMLEYVFSAQYVPASAGADPFTASADAVVMLNSMRTWAGGAGIATHDIGQIWTARNIFGCGSGSGLIGCAWIGQVCESSRYNVCEDWSSSMSCLRALSAHEIGHNWSGIHSQAPNSTFIMWPFIGCNNTSFSAGNLTRMQNHIDSRTCLASCNDPCTISITAVSVIPESCANANNGQIFFTTNTPSPTTTFILAGPVNQSNHSGFFNNLPDGTYTISASDDLISDCTTPTQEVIVGTSNTNNLQPACINNTIYIQSPNGYTLTDADVIDLDATLSDCGTPTVVSITPSTLTCDDIGDVIEVQVVVSDPIGNMANCTALITVEKGESLPSGWDHTDIGGATGDASYDPCIEKFCVESNGISFPNSDKVHYAYKQVCGNSEIIARVASVSNNGLGGIMFRESLDAGSKKVAMRTHLNGAYFVQRDIRTYTNSFSTSQQIFRPGHDWLKIVRNGNQFLGYTSTNGSYWQFAFFANVPMNYCIYVGLYAEGPIDNITTQACFDNVQCSGTQEPTFTENNTGIQVENQSRVNLNIYPNPAQHEINVSLQDYLGKEVDLTVFNSIGQAVKVIQLDRVEIPTERIDLPNLKDGIYLLEIRSGNDVRTKKFVISNN